MSEKRYTVVEVPAPERLAKSKRRAKVVYLFGTMHGEHALREAQLAVTLAGNVPLVHGTLYGEDARMKAHKRAIDVCDYAICLDAGGRPRGESVAVIEYADYWGKRVAMLELPKT